MIRPTLAVSLLVSLAACNDAGPAAQPTADETGQKPKSRTVLQFLEDPAALDEIWARCRNDPGGIGDTPDCRNAGHAKERIMMVGREHAIEVLKR
jgi:predicted small lipoprotein YifL